MASTTRPVIEYGIASANTTAELAGYINEQLNEHVNYTKVYLQTRQQFKNQ